MENTPMPMAQEDSGVMPPLRQLPNPIASCVVGGLILVLASFYSLDFLRENLQQARAFVLSPHFLFLGLGAGLLSYKRITGYWHDLLVVVLACVYLLLFYGEGLALFKMRGDNICQVAYWNILFRPDLQGSIGVSFTKPGQVAYLGLLYQLSLLMGQQAGLIFFKFGLCLVMAACIWSMVKIAMDIGGRAAGVLAFLLTSWAFLFDFIGSESTIYVIATLFAGLRLYCYHPRLRGLGRLLLVLSLQFRIEAVAVLGIIWLVQLYRRDWRELMIFSLALLVSLCLFVFVVLQIQGSLDRLNSGAAVGYVAPPAGYGEPPLDGEITGDELKGDKFGYMLSTFRDEMSASPLIRLLFIMAIFGVAGAVTYQSLPYLAVFASLIIVILNVLILGGTFNLDRYFSLVYGFACSVGAGGLAAWLKNLLRGRGGLVGACCLTGLALGGMALFDFSLLNAHQAITSEGDTLFYQDAVAIIFDENLREAKGLLSEDDLLSHIVVMAPDRFQRLASLQHFNVASEAKRKEILGKVDYIWIDLHGYLFFYLYHMADPAWRDDPFRQLVGQFFQSAEPGTLYGFQIIPVALDSDRLILRVAPEGR